MLFTGVTRECTPESRTSEGPECGCVAVAMVYAKGDAYAAKDAETYVIEGRADLLAR